MVYINIFTSGESMELSNKSLNERYKIAFISVLIGLC